MTVSNCRNPACRDSPKVEISIFFEACETETESKRRTEPSGSGFSKRAAPLQFFSSPPITSPLTVRSFGRTTLPFLKLRPPACTSVCVHQRLVSGRRSKKPLMKTAMSLGDTFGTGKSEVSFRSSPESFTPAPPKLAASAAAKVVSSGKSVRTASRAALSFPCAA